MAHSQEVSKRVMSRHLQSMFEHRTRADEVRSVMIGSGMDGKRNQTCQGHLPARLVVHAELCGIWQSDSIARWSQVLELIVNRVRQVAWSNSAADLECA